MTRCCDGSTAVHPNGENSHAVLCGICDRVLAVVDGPREEVYADL